MYVLASQLTCFDTLLNPKKRGKGIKCEMYLLTTEKEQTVILILFNACIRALATIADNIVICKMKLINNHNFRIYSLINYDLYFSYIMLLKKDNQCKEKT